MDYETIDKICDSTNPALFAWALVLIAYHFYKKSPGRFPAVLSLILGLSVVYGLQFLDSAYAMWSSLKLDYSTHSAFALVMTLTISCLMKRIWIPVAIFIIYEILVLYQKYHTLADVISTLIVVAAPLILIRVMLQKLGIRPTAHGHLSN